MHGLPSPENKRTPTDLVDDREQWGCRRIGGRLADETAVSSWRTAGWAMELRSSRYSVISVPSALAEAAAGGVSVVGVDPQDDIEQHMKSRNRQSH